MRKTNDHDDLSQATISERVRMGIKSKIEWTDSSWSPVRARTNAGRVGWHCETVSEGCRNCYAAGINRRLGTGLDFKPGHRRDIELFLDEKMLLAPLRWRTPRRVFVCSMTDLFADFVSDEWLDRIFAVMALAPQHCFQVLTKRPERMQRYVAAVADESVDATVKRFAPHMQMPWPRDWPGFEWPLPNVWLGTSCEDQARADERIPHLLATPAAVRFVSLEPLLGPIDLDAFWTEYDHRPTYPFWQEVQRLQGIEPNGKSIVLKSGLDWVIIGGESGRGARDYNLAWPRAIIAQCHAADVAVFHKQIGSAPVTGGARPGSIVTGYPHLDRKGGDMAEWPEDLRVREIPHRKGDADA